MKKVYTHNRSFISMSTPAPLHQLINPTFTPPTAEWDTLTSNVVVQPAKFDTSVLEHYQVWDRGKIQSPNSWTSPHPPASKKKIKKTHQPSYKSRTSCAGGDAVKTYQRSLTWCIYDKMLWSYDAHMKSSRQVRGLNNQLPKSLHINNDTNGLWLTPIEWSK